MKKGFVSWSGGKDCNFAMYQAAKSGYEISFLLNMVRSDSSRCAWHGIKNDFLKVQADAIGVPIIQEKTTLDSYESDFKRVCRRLKDDGIDYGIFGDIDLDEHRDWVERVCRDVGIVPVLPLWMRKQRDIMNDFIDEGFKAFIISVKNDIGINRFLGSYIDKKILDEMIKAGITACGELGEFHTIVTDGHYFKKRLNIVSGHKYVRSNYEFFDIDELTIDEK
jgi:uncharacterized protein (TIGR00290 family)